MGLATASAWAQPLPPSEAGVTMGHWHLNSGDVDANRKIFLALGGTAFKLGTFEIVKFPGVYVYLNMPQGAPPSAGGNDGAVVNQVGVAVQSLQETAARLKASGVQVQPGVNGRADDARSESGRRNTRSESELCESRQADHHNQGAGARPHRIRCEESRGVLE